MFKRYLGFAFILSVLLLTGCKSGSSTSASLPEANQEQSVTEPGTRDDGPVGVTPTAAITSQPLRVELDGDTAQLSWPATAGTDSYHLEITGDNGYQNYLTFNASETQHAEPLLATNVLYRFDVTAYDAGNVELVRYEASARINLYAKMISDETNP